MFEAILFIVITILSPVVIEIISLFLKAKLPLETNLEIDPKMHLRAGLYVCNIVIFVFHLFSGIKEPSIFNFIICLLIFLTSQYFNHFPIIIRKKGPGWVFWKDNELYISKDESISCRISYFLSTDCEKSGKIAFNFEDDTITISMINTVEIFWPISYREFRCLISKSYANLNDQITEMIYLKLPPNLIGERLKDYNSPELGINFRLSQIKYKFEYCHPDDGPENHFHSKDDLINPPLSGPDEPDDFAGLPPIDSIEFDKTKTLHTSS